MRGTALQQAQANGLAHGFAKGGGGHMAAPVAAYRVIGEEQDGAITRRLRRIHRFQPDECGPVRLLQMRTVAERLTPEVFSLAGHAARAHIA